jgi:hypothetical protein
VVRVYFIAPIDCILIEPSTLSLDYVCESQSKMASDHEVTWHQELASGDDAMGWAVCKIPRDESETQWIDTIKLNFECNTLDDRIEAKMSWRMCHLLGHVPEVPIHYWDSVEDLN